MVEESCVCRRKNTQKMKNVILLKLICKFSINSIGEKKSTMTQISLLNLFCLSSDPSTV